MMRTALHKLSRRRSKSIPYCFTMPLYPFPQSARGSTKLTTIPMHSLSYSRATHKLGPHNYLQWEVKISLPAHWQSARTAVKSLVVALILRLGSGILRRVWRSFNPSEVNTPGSCRSRTPVMVLGLLLVKTTLYDFGIPQTVWRF